MACIEWKEKLMEYAMKELPSNEARELELHLETCTQCALALKEFSELHGVMSQHFTDLEMPSHLVLLPERTARAPWKFFSTPWAAAAWGGAFAAIFVAGLLLGGLLGRGPSSSLHEQVAKNAVSRADIEAMVAQEVSAKLTEQKVEFKEQNEKLAESLRQEQTKNLGQIAHQMQGLELAQSAVWKETQQQNEFVGYIARNYLPPTSQPGGGLRR
ncbi:MAG TPA: zf-HC2 domain-containing protein [Terriglobia bacterium]|nr:zf-HC2 domain-containing protein [Terriglobia bacterium]